MPDSGYLNPYLQNFESTTLKIKLDAAEERIRELKRENRGLKLALDAWMNPAPEPKPKSISLGSEDFDEDEECSLIDPFEYWEEDQDDAQW